MKFEQPKLYTKESNPGKITLTKDQIKEINHLTLNLDEVIEESVLEMFVENNDIAKTLENGHPLNRLITNPEGKLSGYVACEDFIPKEAYIKYLGTDGNSKKNLLSELPAFFEYAQSQGYTKLNFHGWNERLNNILKRYGFERLRTDSIGEFSADFYEKTLQPQKTEEEIQTERIKAFEDKFIQKVHQEYNKTLQTFKENEQTIITKINQNADTLSNRIKDTGIELTDKNKIVLKLKLARHFQQNDTLDTNVLVDALVETPKFLESDKGSIYRLFEIHEQKTLQKIAEMRKNRAEKTGEEYNPYEALFTTPSGDYYMARLLNMPHLEEESEYMNHCVGTSDSYVSKIKRGEVEILSFRKTPTINKDENKLNNNDTPIITIEYNLESKTIQQMKKYEDEYLQTNDPYYNDILDALSQLRETTTDTGEKRDFESINSSELQNIFVADYHVFTNKGEISIQDYNPNDPTIFILKKGDLDISNSSLTPQDIEKIIQIETGQSIAYTEIAFGFENINTQTKMYIGPLFNGVFNLLPVERIFTTFPNGKIENITIDSNYEFPTSESDWLKALQDKDIHLMKDSQNNEMLGNMEQTQLPHDVSFALLTVSDLGFGSGVTYEQICNKATELGLELCAQDDGPKLRLLYDQKFNTCFRTAIKPIEVSGGELRLWDVDRSDDGTRKLTWSFGDAGRRWRGDDKFVFRVRKS
jgi:hypothetical protein